MKIIPFFVKIRTEKNMQVSEEKMSREENTNQMGEKIAANKQDVIFLHIAVMLFGLAGVVAQFVKVPAIMVALGRVISSSLMLLVIVLVKKDKLRLNCGKDYVLIILTGIVMAGDWSTSFQSIKVSTVAIGAITFSTFPLFLTFLEPLVFHERICTGNIVKTILLLAGVMITIPEFSLDNDMTVGIMWGMICSLTYAVMTLANRYFSERYVGRVICLYEQGTAAVVLLPSLLWVQAQWRPTDILGVAFTGIICTAFAYSLYVTAQKGVKAQTAGIISGMETVYGILYALIFLGEVPAIREIVGGVVILGVALCSSIWIKET